MNLIDCMKIVKEKPLCDRRYNLGSVGGETALATRSDDSISSFSIENNNQEYFKKEKKCSYKEVKFESCLQGPKINIDELRDLSWSGIPTEHRSETWKVLLGYLPMDVSAREITLLQKRHDYRCLMCEHYTIKKRMYNLDQNHVLRELLLVDIPRMVGSTVCDKQIKKCVERLLYIWFMCQPDSMHLENIMDILTLLLVVFLDDIYSLNDTASEVIEIPPSILEEVEADCFWCLTGFFANINNQSMCMRSRLETILQCFDSDLLEYLRLNDIDFTQLDLQWMHSFMSKNFPIDVAIRIWDTYLSEGDNLSEFHVYTCAVALRFFRVEIYQLESESLFNFIQHLPTMSWNKKQAEMILSEAFVLRLKNKETGWFVNSISM